MSMESKKKILSKAVSSVKMKDMAEKINSLPVSTEGKARKYYPSMTLNSDIIDGVKESDITIGDKVKMVIEVKVVSHYMNDELASGKKEEYRVDVMKGAVIDESK